MTGKGGEEEKDTKIQTGPDTTESGSLAEDFAEGPGIVLTGHPAMQEEEPPPEGKKEETPEGGDKKSPETPPEKKYKTHEEAEEGAREHQRFATEKAEEAKREKEAREALERENADLKKKLEEAPKPPEKSEKPVSDDELNAQVEAVAEAANEEALATIAELDRTDPDYPKKVAKAWAKANAKVVKAAARAPLSQADIDALIDQRLQTKEAETAAQREEQRKKDETAEAARIEAKAKELGSKAGLDLDDPESADSIIWDRMAKQIPQEVYDKNSLEAQVEWVAGEVRKRTGKVAQTTAEREEAARIAQNNNTVLGKGGVKPSKTSPKREDLGSLGSDFEEVKAQRTIS
jgi:hypothetical protein